MLPLWVFLIAFGDVLVLICLRLPIIAKLFFVDYYTEVCMQPKNISGSCSFISEQKVHGFLLNTEGLADSFCDMLLTCRAHLCQAMAFSNVSGKD